MKDASATLANSRVTSPSTVPLPIMLADANGVMRPAPSTAPARQASQWT